jgi:hypothetical protein
MEDAKGWVLLTVTPSGKVNRTVFPNPEEAKRAGALAVYAEKAHEYKDRLAKSTLEELWVWWRRESRWPSVGIEAHSVATWPPSQSGGRWELPVPNRTLMGDLTVSSVIRWPDNVVVAEIYPALEEGETL